MAEPNRHESSTRLGEIDNVFSALSTRTMHVRDFPSFVPLSLFSAVAGYVRGYYPYSIGAHRHQSSCVAVRGVRVFPNNRSPKINVSGSAYRNTAVTGYYRSIIKTTAIRRRTPRISYDRKPFPVVGSVCDTCDEGSWKYTYMRTSCNIIRTFMYTCWILYWRVSSHV